MTRAQTTLTKLVRLAVTKLFIDFRGLVFSARDYSGTPLKGHPELRTPP